MSDDDKMFLEFMDYLAFEEYEKEQEEAARQAELDDENDDDDYDELPVYRSTQRTAPAKNVQTTKVAYGSHKDFVTKVIVFIAGSILIHAIIFKMFGTDDVSACIAFLLSWRLGCKLSDKKP